MAWESPKHKVEVDGFWMYTREVTNQQYGKFLEAAEHEEPLFWDDERFNGPEQPVVGVSWEDTQAYCEWGGTRLPTEAEWEYASRGGDERVFPWGDECPPKTMCGNFADRTAKRQFPRGFETKYASKFAPGGGVHEYTTRFPGFVPGYEDGCALTAPVGSFPANPLGVHDLAGNVWEWCEEWQAKYPGAAGADKPAVEACRVARGGSFYNTARSLRCAYRSTAFPPDLRSYFLGFRCVLEPEADSDAEDAGVGDDPAPDNDGDGGGTAEFRR